MPYEPITRLNHYGAKNPLARMTKPEGDGEGKGERAAAERRRRQGEGDSWGRAQDSKRESRTPGSQTEPTPRRPTESGWCEPAIIGRRSDAPTVSGTSDWCPSASPSVHSVKLQRDVAEKQEGGEVLPIPFKSLDNYGDMEREERQQQKQRRRELRRQFILDLKGQNPGLPTASRASQEFEDIPLTPPMGSPLPVTTTTKPSQIQLPSSRKGTPRTPVATLPQDPRGPLLSPLQQSKLAFIHNCLQANYGDGYLSRMLVMCDGNEMEVVRRLTTGNIPKAMRGADPMMPLDEHGRFSLDKREKKKVAGKT